MMRRISHMHLRGDTSLRLSARASCRPAVPVRRDAVPNKFMGFPDPPQLDHKRDGKPLIKKC